MSRTNIDEKIARLEAELKNAKAAKSKETRQERNSQLMAFGIAVELIYKNSTKEEREKVKSWLLKDIDARNAERVQAGFSRLDIS